MMMDELTIEEKINLVKGKGNWHTNDLNGKFTSIHLSDGPHGLRAQSENAKSNNDSIVATCFPTSSAIACSFDRNLVNKVASAISLEAKCANVSILLGPGVNIKRSPLCGRNFEYYSEDPYLTGELATEFVRGVQMNGVGTSLKHFAGNNQETNRMTSDSRIDERTLREIYLRAFEKVIKDARPATVMASYNLLNGKPACENEWLLTDVLRNEWGYRGLVMSDWGASVDAPKCIEAGMDLEMPDSRGNHKEAIINALADGSLREESLDEAVKRVIELSNNYPPSFKGGLKEIPKEVLKENYALSVEASIKSAVLLKNENVLPISNPERVVIVGSLAKKMRIQGGGSSHIKTDSMPNILDVFREEGIETVYFEGYDSDSLCANKLTRKDLNHISTAMQGIKKILEENKNTPIILFGGLTDKAEGEGYDRTSLHLPHNQTELFRSIKNITENVIYVSFGGSPYDMSEIIYSKAILHMYLGGEGVSRACVSLLLGENSPSGRLAESWPLKLEDTPAYGCFGMQNENPYEVPYKERMLVGYRHYDTNNVKVRFPFGYGLSYTEFSYSNMQVARVENDLIVKVDVTNTGDIAGSETLLLFVNNAESDFMRAKRELRGFNKVTLNPKETKRVTVKIDDYAFKVFDVVSNSFVTIKGEYELEISKSVGDVILSEKIYIDGANSLKEEAIDFSSDNKDKVFTAKSSLAQMAPFSFGARLMLKLFKLVVWFMTGKSLDDPEARMMYGAIKEGNIDTICNQSGGVFSPKLMNKLIVNANKVYDKKRSS